MSCSTQHSTHLASRAQTVHPPCISIAHASTHARKTVKAQGQNATPLLLHNYLCIVSTYHVQSGVLLGCLTAAASPETASAAASTPAAAAASGAAAVGHPTTTAPVTAAEAAAAASAPAAAAAAEARGGPRLLPALPELQVGKDHRKGQVRAAPALGILAAGREVLLQSDHRLRSGPILFTSSCLTFSITP